MATNVIVGESVVTLQTELDMAKNLLSVDNSHLRSFNVELVRRLAECARKSDEQAGRLIASTGKIAKQIHETFQNLPTSVRGLVENNLEKIVSAVIDDDDRDIVAEVEDHFWRRMIVEHDLR